MPAPKLTKTSVTNALAAATEAGLKPSAMVVQGDGSIRLEFLHREFDNVANSEPTKDKSTPKKWGED